MLRQTIPYAILVALLCATVAPLEADAMWNMDLKYQHVSKRPRIEARYVDASRTALEILAEDYRVVIDLHSRSGQRIRTLSPYNANALAGGGAYLTLTAGDGRVYSSLNSKTASRVNIYRRGPYYIETHWLDVTFTDSKGDVAPVKGEVVLYSYPEKTHVGVILHVTKDIEVRDAAMVFDFDAAPCDEIGPNCRVIRRKAGSVALLYQTPGGVDGVTSESDGEVTRVSNHIHRGEAARWKEGDKPKTFFAVFPLPGSTVSRALEAELRPLVSTSITTRSGRSLGYDPIRGCYTLQTDNTGNFSYHYYDDQNAYEVADFSIANDGLPRKVYILHETKKNPGLVECGVVLDEKGDTLPVTVQISKNFAGEIEEPFYNPHDTPFSETCFPLYLNKDEKRKLTSLHLYQNWGNHPLKQFSSLGAWMDYYHMSTGVTETTCYVPFLFAGLPGVSIADFRPMSQKMWESQPQHDNIAGHSFLRYQDDKGKWHYVEYTGTTFRSTGPNWADMSMGYLSDDGKARVTIDVFELPQTDELRNFIRMRVDFLDDINLKAESLSCSMRLLNIASWVQGMRYKNIAYGGATGEPTVVPIQLNDKLSVDAAPIPVRNGWAAVYPDHRGNNAFLVGDFAGKIGGEPVAPGVSLLGKKDGNTEFFLVPITRAKQIKKGDWIETNLALMPYGSADADWKPARKCAVDYGANAPKVTSVKAGKKLGDYPTRITLDGKGRAEFSVSGGMNTIPIVIHGAKDYSSLRLYNVDGEEKLIEHSQPGKRDGYQVFVDEDGTFGYVFLVNTDGKEHRYTAE